MAMGMKWWCFSVWLLLLASCSGGVHRSIGDEMYYEEVPSSEHNSYLQVQLLHPTQTTRMKRYLAGEFDTPSFGRASLTSDSEIPHESGSESVSVLANQTGSNGVELNTSQPLSTTGPSVLPNVNDSKTGGNYMSVHDSVINSTIQNASTTEIPVTSGHTTTNASSIDPKAETNATIPSNVTRNINNSETNSTITDITIGDIFEKINLTQHNIYTTKQDSHVYYNSTFSANDENLGKYYWINMDRNPNTQINDMLSQSHRRAATVKLSFDFPFYGHIVRNVTIATGGFLYTGDYVHSWLAATQYIAPLMANFDTSLSNESFVKYMDNGTQFTVQWEKVKLQDKPDSGAFTFQATLRKNGDITFVYKNVPVVISNITDDYHPVKVGLSDAYIIDRHVLFVRRKTIYEYHRITFEHLSISNWTVINLIALPTCLQATDCESCLTMGIGFDCSWCPETSKCSSGIDRNRQDWIIHECHHSSINNISICPAVSNISDTNKHRISVQNFPEDEVHTEQTVTALLADESSSTSVSSLIGILMCIGFLMSLSLWGLYAYRNPHTTSGQLLIKYRPSQWSWRRGEARYTAATIHM